MSLRGRIYGFLAYNTHIRGKIENAEILYKKATELGMTNIRYQMGYGMLLLKKGSFAEARQIFSNIVINTPKNDKVHISAKTNLALAYWKMNEVDTAVELITETHNKLRNSVTYGTLGYFLIEQGDLDKALEFNLKALEYDDEDPVILDNVAQVYYRMGDRKKAKDYFLKAEEQKPDQVDTLYYLGCIYKEEGNRESAVEKWNKALSCNISALNTISREAIEKELNELN